MKYIITNSSIVLFINNKPFKIDKTNALFSKVIQQFDLPENEQESAIKNVIFNTQSPNTSKDGLDIKDESVYIDNVKLPDVLAKKVIAMHKEDLPLSLFKNFWKNLQENPSRTSVSELYDFLSYKDLPLTEDGCFLAYKRLDDKFWSINGNKNTTVLKGKVDKDGKIYNGIGEEIEVLRRDVDDNREHHCSDGLHIGSRDYAQNFASGKMVVVKVNPKDVVSVPSDYNCQKCRVAAYQVVSIYENEITATVVDENNEAVQSEYVEQRDDFIDRVNSYLTKQIAKNITSVSVRKIQNSFSPEYPSRQRVLDALDDLGYYWCKEEKGEIVYLED